jgi:hypothetical protein
VHWWGSIRCNVSDMVRLGQGIGREGVGGRGELRGGWISWSKNIVGRSGVNVLLQMHRETVTGRMQHSRC